VWVAAIRTVSCQTSSSCGMSLSSSTAICSAFAATHVYWLPSRGSGLATSCGKYYANTFREGDGHDKSIVLRGVGTSERLGWQQWEMSLTLSWINRWLRLTHP
jgi:hypothetical protein